MKAKADLTGQADKHRYQYLTGLTGFAGFFIFLSAGWQLLYPDHPVYPV